MSERILKALMQLFAILARPDVDSEERRQVVRNFLSLQLNEELVAVYLTIFDEYYETNRQKQQATERRNKRTSAISVKVLKICTNINEELTQKQKIVLFILLLEFIKSDGEISGQEWEFIETVAILFHLTSYDLTDLTSFILKPLDILNAPTNLLLINDSLAIHPEAKVKHTYIDALNGEILVLHIQSVNLYVAKYFGENEMYMNGQLLRQGKSYILTSGISIRNSMIKPLYFSDITSAFSNDTEKTKTVLEVSNLSYKFKGGKTGLQTMSFLERSGKLVGIMGVSGAGKSTLLNVLNGTLQPETGEVLINGINIHKEKDRIEGIIGYVSQDDLLIEELTVFQNLYYNAKLCFSDYSEFQITRVVLKLLKNLGLYETKDMKVGSPLDKKISGGQRKRLNIALELIREPAVLFLDEPTSGLSSRDSENILDLLKELTLKGKLVFVVIHQPSSDIFKMFDKLIILDNGGYLIYNGDPVDSIIYFKSRIQQADWKESECKLCGNVNPEQIFNIIEAQILDEYGNFTQTRKISPKKWNEYYVEYSKKNRRKSVSVRRLPEVTFKIPNRIKQFIIFIKRDILSKLTNSQYLLINTIEAPLLAFLLSYIIKYYNVDVANELGYTFCDNSNLPIYIFMSVIVALFIGLTVSAEEIIKDRKILKREEFLNLSRASYLMSKVVILLTLSAIQTFLFVLIGNSVIEIKGMFFRYWFVLFSTCGAANLMGLNISDGFKTSVTIYILIPFLIIPQIILSGVIVKYDKLNPKISSPNSIPFYGEIITARWAYEALAVHQYKENIYEKALYPYEKLMSHAEYKKNYWLRNLDNKIVNCQRALLKKQKDKAFIADLEVLRNEINRELQDNKLFTLSGAEMLYPDKLNSLTISNIRTYFKELEIFYRNLYNNANRAKDEFVSHLQNSDSLKQDFINTKRKYHNDGLEEMVRNASELNRIVEYEGYLFQKNDPVFQEPRSNFIKAHFYSPIKKVFGRKTDTYYANVIIIWLMTAILYISLYYRWIYKFLLFIEETGEKLNSKMPTFSLKKFRKKKNLKKK